MTDLLTEARRLAGADDLLRARELVRDIGHRDRLVLSDEAQALEAELQRLTAHADSREAYEAFYAEVSPARPFTPMEFLADAHLRFPRWGYVREQLLARQTRTVLELGCFDAWTLLNLTLAEPRITAVGVDLTPHAVLEANRRAARFTLPLRVQEGFLEDLQLEQRFDAVLLLEILEHVRDVDVALAVAERHLAPGGVVYVSFPLTAPVHAGERERREHLRLFDHGRALALLTAPGRSLVWYVQFPVGGDQHGVWHHCGAYRCQ